MFFCSISKIKQISPAEVSESVLASLFVLVVVVLPRNMGSEKFCKTVIFGGGGTPRRPTSRATPQGLDQRSKLEEVVPKMARLRGLFLFVCNILTAICTIKFLITVCISNTHHFCLPICFQIKVVCINADQNLIQINVTSRLNIWKWWRKLKKKQIYFLLALSVSCFLLYWFISSLLDPRFLDPGLT